MSEISRTLGALHPGIIESEPAIRRLLNRSRDQGVQFRCGLNRNIEPQLAVILEVTSESILVAADGFEEGERSVLLFSFEIDDQPYVFSTSVVGWKGPGRVELKYPSIVYFRERRGRGRLVRGLRPDGLTVSLGGSRPSGLEVIDISPNGFGALVTEEFAGKLTVGTGLSVHGDGLFDGWAATVRSLGTVPGTRDGWVRLGLEVSPFEQGKLATEDLADLEARPVLERVSEGVSLAFGRALLAVDRVQSVAGTRVRREVSLDGIEIVEFHDRRLRRLVGTIDSWRVGQGGIGVVIPPAWGKTKETLLPLAATIVACCKKNGIPVSVLRFDGINKRGESYREGKRDAAGRGQHRFTFSQGVEDIQAAVEFLKTHARPRKVVLVSFSAASIEARRAVAENPEIDGWVCVVGSADAQSMMRSISGGIDFAVGIERGVRFGLQEILGVTVDMDLAGTDALRHGLVYMVDAKRDMGSIRAPITWISGKFDAWMDADRVRDALSVGDTRHRKFVTVPTGHVLRDSREALRVFQLIAREVGEIAGYPMRRHGLPRLDSLKRRSRAERARLEQRDIDLKAFWADYLLGRDRSIGFELMALTESYRRMMRLQVSELQLASGARVVDVGGGTGAFIDVLATCPNVPGVRVIEVDFVRDGLKRARDRNRGLSCVDLIEANLDPRNGTRVGWPIASGSIDAVLASLFLSYVAEPAFVVREARRVLRPGGRLVLSSLIPDADMSRLFREGVEELRCMWVEHDEQVASISDFDSAARAYMNEAARLLDLEEEGQFGFLGSEELVEILRSNGFEVEGVFPSFGDPPQATVVSGR